MLRTLLGVVLISIVVTPIFAEENKILPKIYSQKDYDIISNYYDMDYSFQKDQDENISEIFIYGEGSSTNEAFCNVLSRVYDFVTSPNEIKSELRFLKGMISKSNGISDTTSFEEIKFKINKKYLRCKSTLVQTETEFYIKSTTQSNYAADGEVFLALQQGNWSVLEYGILGFEQDITVILLISFKL
jgi:hypothetical protein